MVTAIFLACFTAFLAGQNIWYIKSQLKAGSGDPYGRKWHKWQAAVCATVLFFSFYIDYRVAIIWPSFHWFFFDLLINKFALGRSAFYVGSTSAIDRWFQKNEKPELNIKVAKVSLLVLSTIIAIVL